MIEGSRLWLCLLLLGIAVERANAGALDAPGADLEVSLITYGPGAIYWERFGHNAIRIRDRISGESGDFNYGAFDFEDSAFFLNFARGRMRYVIDAEPSGTYQQDYIDEGRSVVAQRLALSPAQAEHLRAFLLWNLRPENLSYDYDYFTSNCSTRIRDALDLVLGGQLQRALAARPAQLTYRQQVDRIMLPQPVLMLSMNFGLGPFADQTLTEWQESFLPTVLARELRSVRLPDGHGGERSLVMTETEIAPARLPAQSDAPPDLNLPFAMTGVALAIVMLACRLRFPAWYAAQAVAYLVASGIAGTLLLALWALTSHRAAWANANLLVFNPVAFAMLSAAWRTRHGAGGSRLARILLVLQLAAALLAVLLHVLPGLAQQNLPWLLLAIPVWVAIAAGQRKRRVTTVNI